MKVKLLKYLRRRVFSKYQVMKANDRLWHVFYSQNGYFGDAYETKEQAITAMKNLWHDEAKDYLWEHHNERKRNYPW